MSGRTEWSNFITVDRVSGAVTVNQNNYPFIVNNSFYDVWYTGISSGDKRGHKRLRFHFMIPPVNGAPYFTEDPLDIFMAVDG